MPQKNDITGKCFTSDDNLFEWFDQCHVSENAVEFRQLKVELLRDK